MTKKAISSTNTTTTTTTRASNTFFFVNYFFIFVILLESVTPTISMTITNININKNSATSPSNSSSSDMRFGKFNIPSTSIFYRTSKSAAFVNLRPIVPGHVLVMPERIVPTMEELPEDEYLDMWKSVRVVQAMLKRQYKGTTAFNVAVQDGRAAGQSVPHVHVHILPRTAGDFERNDDVYDELEAWAPRDDIEKVKTNIDVPDDADRVDRTLEMMAEEAEMYRKLLQELDGETEKESSSKL